MRKQTIKKEDKYNRLTAIRFDHKKGNHQYWLFRCDCGNKKVIEVSSVKIGATKSCGCLKKEMLINKNTTHGMTKTREYVAWYHMKRRCYNKNYKKYKNWGGRGITVCNRWLKFENFYKDMGKRPARTSIDRIDNNGNYEPNNCRWATVKEQNNNRRSNRLLTFNRKTQNITQWTNELGINRSTLYSRLRYGWSVEKALTNN